eukprot:scaffold39856_cov64-Phaeocystis_antarctica.AAC.2
MAPLSCSGASLGGVGWLCTVAASHVVVNSFTVAERCDNPGDPTLGDPGSRLGTGYQGIIGAGPLA